MSHSISVRLTRHASYQIHLGHTIWDELNAYFMDHFAEKKILILIDAKVHRLQCEKIEKECQRYFQTCHILQIPEGEKSKSISQWKELLNTLLHTGIERGTPLLAVGGGVTGDLAGFVAASALRGIPLIHMPTSLLAMVDSSIGGKTGVNHPAGKNLIGAFYQPDAVFTHLQFLKTLERREWIGGLAEMLKYAAISDPTMFDELRQAIGEGFQPTSRWLNLISRSAAIKADIVEQDEHEAGKRAFLNFGHTFGHALEKCSGYGNISHGEAVFTGMLAGVYYSQQGGAPVSNQRFAFFKSLYDINLPSKDRIPELVQAMRYDKKVKDGNIRLILLKDWGQPYVQVCESEDRLVEAWQAAFKEINGA